MTSLANIDGDIVAYRCAASCEKRDKEGNLLSLDPLEIAIVRTDKLVREILEATQTLNYHVYISGDNNFRYKVDALYKANRTQPKPEWLAACKEFLQTEWKATKTDGYEADDALGMAQTDDTICVSIDKDLLQLPGKHYQWSISGPNWTKEAKFLEVSYFDGLRHFYCSSLIGDRVDNVIGVEGLGPKKSAKALSLCTTEQELFDTCRLLYKDDERYFKNLRLLWVWREQDDIYDEVKRGLVHVD